MIVPLLVLAFVVVPIAELYVILQVGSWLGILPTVAILILDSILGSMLLRAQGRSAWRRFNDSLSAGRPPAREVLDGGLIILGGAFLLTPGFLTDLIGLLLLIPPTRAVVRRLVVRRFARTFITRATGGGHGGRAPAGEHPYDVEGSAVEVDPPHLRR